MPLISCPHCLGKLSTAAASCPSCGRPNAARVDETPASWPQPSAYGQTAESAAGYGSAASSYGGAVEAPVTYAAPPVPQELECPLCRLRQKNRTLCSRCDERLVEPRFNPPHNFPRVPVDYAGTGVRLGALIVDGLVLLPVVALLAWWNPEGPGNTTLAIFVWLVVLYGYRIGFTAATGQTLGKRLVEIEVRRADGGRVGLREASLRYLPDVAFGVVITLVVSAMVAMPSPSSYDTGTAAQAGVMGAALATGLVEILYGAYSLGDIIAFFASPRRRALHDFLAGTVVVYS
jgi:uncharacterized RDD family membrane protein YckC